MATSLAGKGRQNAYAAVAASTTDGALITGVASRKIRVVAVTINHGDTTASTVTFNGKSAGSGVAIMPPLKGAANGTVCLPDLPTGWFQTTAGEGLTATTGAGSTTSIVVVYELCS